MNQFDSQLLWRNNLAMVKFVLERRQTNMNDVNDKSSFWASIPGILTGLAALLGAMATLFHILKHLK